MTQNNTNIKDGEQVNAISDKGLLMFSLGSSVVRGRLVRSSDFIDDVLSWHNYPDAVNRYVRECIVMSVIFSSLFKYEGIFSVQINAEGPITMLACDVTSKGDVRALATYDEQALAQIDADDMYKDGGTIMFTVDNAETARRYQGIVAIHNGSIEQSFSHYFNQSEQIPTEMMYVDKGDKLAALVVQKLPEDGGEEIRGVNKALSEDDQAEKENWNRAVMLMKTCTQEELLSPDITNEELVFRLFHEEDVVLYSPMNLQAKCRCSAEKADRVLMTLPREDIKEISINGQITFDCEFCNSKYVFDEEEITRRIEEMSNNA